MMATRVRFIKGIFWQQFDFEIKRPIGLCNIPDGAVGQYHEETKSYIFPEQEGTENSGKWNPDKQVWQYRIKRITPTIPAWFFKPSTKWGNEPLQFEFL